MGRPPFSSHENAFCFQKHGSVPIHELIRLCVVLPAFPVFGEGWQGYVGAKGQSNLNKIGHLASAYFHLDHRMILEGGIYRLSASRRNLVGSSIGATIFSRDRTHYIESPDSGFGDDSPWNGDDEEAPDYYCCWVRHRDWHIPIQVNLHFMRFPGKQIGIGRYYRAGIRIIERSYTKWQGKWGWESATYADLQYHLGAGYGWKAGSAGNVRLEGVLGSTGRNYVLQVSLHFGWWK